MNGGLLIDYHSCEFFPIRWFDYVLVLRCDNTVLYDRLHERKDYSEQKRTENLECEIMGVVAEEAHDAFPDEGVVHELQNNTEADLQVITLFALVLLLSGQCGIRAAIDCHL